MSLAMGASYCNLLYHIVFATKNREPWLTRDVRERLHAYLGGAIGKEGGIAITINGVSDHVHILAKLRQDKALSKLVGELKANSSGWFSRTFPHLRHFEWQEGYAAFSVSQSQAEKVQNYIEMQEEHHRITPFQDELRKLLKAHGIAFDERYLG